MPGPVLMISETATSTSRSVMTAHEQIINSGSNQTGFKAPASDTQSGYRVLLFRKSILSSSVLFRPIDIVRTGGKIKSFNAQKRAFQTHSVVRRRVASPSVNVAESGKFERGIALTGVFL